MIPGSLLHAPTSNAASERTFENELRAIRGLIDTTSCAERASSGMRFLVAPRFGPTLAVPLVDGAPSARARSLFFGGDSSGEILTTGR
jgi:hypothetical protein